MKDPVQAPYKPSVRLIAYREDAPFSIAGAAKLTLSSRPIDDIMAKMSDEIVIKWIKELVRRGHGSPLEHSSYSFEVTCSRAASHQIVRHRLASYTQLSQRRGDKILRDAVQEAARVLGLKYSREPGQAVKILEKLLAEQPGFDALLAIASQAFIIPPIIVRRRDVSFIINLLEALRNYYRALANHVPYEDARFLLPNAVKTRIYITMNARELVEVFLPLRMCMHAQWEIRYIAWQMHALLHRVHPQIFAYTGPRCVLLDNRVRDTPCTLTDYLSGRCVFVIKRCPEIVHRENIPACLSKASMDPWDLLKYDTS